MKLEKLTTDQEAKIPEVRQFWLDYILSCKNNEINKEAAKIGIDWLYNSVGRKSPIIIYMDSPLSCQYAVAYAKVFAKRFKNFFEDQVGAQVLAQVWAQVLDQVLAQVWAQVGAQVWAQVWAQVGAQVWAQKIEYQRFCAYGSVSDYGWLSFFDFFTQIGVINHKEFNEFKNLLLSGIYDMIQLNGFCIVSSLPKQLNRDIQNRLHSEINPAISFNDGYELFFWHGVSVPKEWITNPSSITKETIAGEKNAEKRRCLREIIGTKRFAELLDIVEIDRDHVNGQDVILYRTAVIDDIINKHIFYVKVICHSTNREYFICIPEDAASNAWSAVAWTFGKKSEEYMPLIES